MLGRCSSTHEIALETAFKTNSDIILIQEPYIFKDLARRISRSHPSFDCFSPIDNWSVRPRVLTYTRKESGLKFPQIRPFNEERGTGDILFLIVHAPRIPSIIVANIYRAPTGATNPGAGLATLLSFSDDSLSPSFILAGDMNLHHKLWQPSLTGLSSPNAEAFIHWLDSKQLHLISELDTPTHNRGNVLDICFASNQLIARRTSATVQSDLDATSDYLPLLITVPSVD
ncbi:hypothetical protein K3495_g4658 [Podosphaera aphanis]|nr:hypothetical protein K3495_g4658 [Podosphaera aphanis]